MSKPEDDLEVCRNCKYKGKFLVAHMVDSLDVGLGTQTILRVECRKNPPHASNSISTFVLQSLSDWCGSYEADPEE